MSCKCDRDSCGCYRRGYEQALADIKNISENELFEALKRLSDALRGGEVPSVKP